MKKQDFRFLLVIIAFACLLVSPTWWKGVPTGNDLQQHYQFAVSLSGAWADGEGYPTGWAAQENTGGNRVLGKLRTGFSRSGGCAGDGAGCVVVLPTLAGDCK